MFKRREFIFLSILSAGVFASLRWPLNIKRKRELKLLLTPELLKSSFLLNGLNRLRDTLADHANTHLSIVHIKKSHKFSYKNALALGNVDLLVTSRAYSYAGVSEAVLFCDLPFGMGGIKKLEFMGLPETVDLRKKIYAAYNLNSLLLGVTPNIVGSVVRKHTDGTRLKVVEKDFSAEIFRARGYEPVKVSGLQQMLFYLKDKKIDVSLAMPPSFWVKQGWDWSDFHYASVDSRKSGHPIEMLVPQNTWVKFDPSVQGVLAEFSQSFSQNFTHEMMTKEMQALNSLGKAASFPQKNEIVELSKKSYRDAFESFAHARHLNIKSLLQGTNLIA